MKDNYFNIVIPTRNRLETLKYALKTVLNQNYSNYQIIISDNNSNDGTEDYINLLNNKKIKYFNTKNNLSMSSNYEFAISKIKNGFVILIGDDDGLLPNALTVANEVINKERVLAIASKTTIYYWPGASPIENILIIPNRKSEIQIRSGNESIDKVINGIWDYPELPMLYTGGIVHTSLIESAKKNGVFYYSFTPDVYSGIAIASILGSNKYVKLDTPLAISGLSRHSNGQSQLGSNRDRTISETFFKENDINFHHGLGDGKIKSVYFLTLEAYMQSQFLRTKSEINIEKYFDITLLKTHSDLYVENYIYLRDQCGYAYKKNITKKIESSISYIFKLIKKLIYLHNHSFIYLNEDVANVYDVSVNHESYFYYRQSILSKFKYIFKKLRNK